MIEQKLALPRRGEPCRHCRVRSCTRPRGLCWRCSADLAIRDLYAPVTKFTRGTEAHAATVIRCDVCGHAAGVRPQDLRGKQRVVCSTCNRPPGVREDYHRRIAEIEARFEECLRDSLPLTPDHREDDGLTRRRGAGPRVYRSHLKSA